jgi:hypothetical protein
LIPPGHHIDFCRALVFTAIACLDSTDADFVPFLEIDFNPFQPQLGQFS